MKKYMFRIIAVLAVVIDLSLLTFMFYKVTEPFAWWAVMCLAIIEVTILAMLWRFITRVDKMMNNREPVPYNGDDDEEEADDEDNDEDTDDDDEEGTDDDDEEEQSFSDAIGSLIESSTATYPEWEKKEKAHDLQWLLDGKDSDYEVKDAEKREEIANEIETLMADCDETLADMFEGELKDIGDRFKNEYDEWRNSLKDEWLRPYNYHVLIQYL